MLGILFKMMFDGGGYDEDLGEEEEEEALAV